MTAAKPSCSSRVEPPECHDLKVLPTEKIPVYAIENKREHRRKEQKQQSHHIEGSRNREKPQRAKNDFLNWLSARQWQIRKMPLFHRVSSIIKVESHDRRNNGGKKQPCQYDRGQTTQYINRRLEPAGLKQARMGQ